MTIVPAREPLTCGQCKVPMESLSVHTDVPGSQAVVVGKCLECDYRHCSVGDCRATVRNVMAIRCPRGHVL